LKKIPELITEKAETTSIGGILDTRVALMSEGEKRKVSICLALLGEARLIVMDEPTGDLDLKSRDMIWGVILEVRSKFPNTSFLISTQNIEEAE